MPGARELDSVAMTAAIWFGLAAIALVGAIVLLYFDRLQRQRTGHVRQVWAKSQGYTYVSVEPSLAANWRRGAMAKLGYLSAVDVVSGNRKGEKFVLFDLEDAATLVAVRRQIGSDIDIDLRLKTAAPPKDHDLELLGAIGDRVVFATNPDIARHAVDQRMVAFIESLPDSVQQLWSEGNWTLGMLSVGTSSREWEAAIDAVLRLSGLLHVLPPVAGGGDGRRDPEPREPEPHDPGHPRAEQPPREQDSRFDEGPQFADRRAYDEERDFDDREFVADRRYRDDTDPDRAPADRDADDDARFAEDRRYEYAAGDADFAPLLGDIAGETEPEPPRRPQLAVVPDPRNRVRRDWPPAEELPDDDESDSAAADFDDDFVEQPEQPGGPFHPGFRPYQGPAPR
ncbi:hypothetical protein NWFMUON74_68130 [Nocardia wallacei]|uniref:Secreted protein n=2 Tax=Nocardia wallacei TaxID=480035 RepID=A0A7G1KVV7_9NOCA|nr:hypothetical protein NWFMUON74_68130 [Nocardia wallacei]